MKSAYILWHEYHHTLPKIERYSIGMRVDTLFIELIEALSAAVFLSKSEKTPYVRLAIRKTDAVKLLLHILWETRTLDTKKYVVLSLKLDEAGKMLGGWHGQLQKQNSPNQKSGEK